MLAKKKKNLQVSYLLTGLEFSFSMQKSYMWQATYFYLGKHQTRVLDTVLKSM